MTNNNTQTEITVTFQNERMRFDNSPDPDVIIGAGVDATNPDKVIAIKGPVDDDFKMGLTYRLYGHWTTYYNKRWQTEEKQFAFKTYCLSEPLGRIGVIAYLKNCKGIGQAIAERLWNEYSGNAVKSLRESPDLVAEKISGLRAPKAREASAHLIELKDLESCTIDLMNVLDGRGLPKAIAQQAVKAWGNSAAYICKTRPYALMRFRGCGFKRCDALYLDLGHPPAKLKRQVLCGWHSVASTSDGHTWHYVDVIRKGLQGAISGADVRFDDAMRVARRHGILVSRWTDGRDGELDWDGNIQWVAEGVKARNEARLAELVVKATKDDSFWDDCIKADAVTGLPGDLSEHQLEVLMQALRGPISVLGGGPGCGKTYTIAWLLHGLISAVGANKIGLAAPTGKAAVRMTEAMEEAGISLRARTWHSLLGVDSHEDGGGWSFRHNESDPLPFRILIGDETSMVDTDLMCSIFRARAKGTMILFVGDVNQLPPVGHGAPLRDLIKAGLPYGELTEVRRNSGTIVQACADMRDSRPFTVVDDVDIEAGRNLIVSPATNADQAKAELITCFSEAKEDGFDPVWDCQVVVPVNKRSELSRVELNGLLQQELNHNDPIPGCPFRLGDKVVNLKNGFLPAVGQIDARSRDVVQNERGEVFVANGELGEVSEVAKTHFVISLTSPDRAVRVYRGKVIESSNGDSGQDDGSSNGTSWDLAYALSVHKSQGAEWPVVIVMVDEYMGAKRLCDRAWLYTAVSRAKKLCILIGKKSTADSYCKVNKIDYRKTFLADLITEEIENGNSHKEKSGSEEEIAEEVIG